jgi:hypothetical protein
MALLLIFALAACGGEKEDDGAKDSAKNYYITYNGQKIEVGADAQKVISKLGKYTSEDGEACGTDEKDVIYTLSGLEIETHVIKDSEIIRKIEILNDSQKTEKGITIGATRDEVIKAYGKDYTEGSGGALRYEGDSSAIEFYFGTAGNVSNIYIKRK